MGGASEGSFNKRKRRRRNKKGNGSEDRQPMQDSASFKQLDGKKVASRAWKMFLAEVSEEGLALMDDQTAREAARRAFRCAEFFMMEESRRKHAQKAAPQQQEKLPLRRKTVIPKRIPAKNNPGLFRFCPAACAAGLFYALGKDL